MDLSILDLVVLGLGCLGIGWGLSLLVAFWRIDHVPLSVHKTSVRAVNVLRALVALEYALIIASWIWP